MEKNYIVTKSNKLISANYDLSLQEQKVILTLASMVQPQDTDLKEYEFKIKDFMQLLGVDTKTKYTEIPKITKELMKKVFEIKEGKDIIQLSWLSSARYKTGEGAIILKFDSNLKPYLLGLKEFYTSYKLENILSLKSKYSVRLYELLKSNAYKKNIEIELEDLKKMVGANASYFKVYADIKRKVLLQAQEELKAKTDISFEFEEVKTGRKVTSVKFSIKAAKKVKIFDDCEIPVSLGADKKQYIKQNSKVENEIAFGVISSEEPQEIQFIKDIKLIIDEKISDVEANKIFNASNGDIEKIREKYNIISKMSNVNNVVGAMIKALKENWTTTGKKKVSTFSDYEGQRQYDFDDLEKKLLGWEVENIS